MQSHRLLLSAALAPLKLAAAAAAFLLLLPLLLPFALLYRIYSAYVQLLVQASEEQLKPVLNMDAMWMQDSAENAAVINGLLVLRRRMPLEELRSVGQLRLIAALRHSRPVVEKFRCLILRRRRRWVWKEDPAFSIDRHVVEFEHGPVSSQRQLEELLSDFCSGQLPSDRPLWQLLLVPTVSPDNAEGCVLLFRCHHVIGDGISLTRLLIQHLVDSPPSVQSPVTFGSETGLLRLLWAAVETPLLLLQQVLMPADCSQLHGPQLTGTKRLAWVAGVQLSRVKSLKRATNCTVNDILMSCLSSAFRRYCLRRGWTVPASLKCYVPIDMRPRQSELQVDNQFTLIFLGLPLADSDPLETLRRTQESMDEVKNSSLPVANYLAMKACMSCLPLWLNKLTFGLLARKSTMVLSNVPGPTEELSVNGCPIESMTFWVPSRANIGVGVSILSYNNQVSVGVITDTGILSDPGQLADDFVVCLEQLETAVRQRAASEASGWR